MDESKEAEYWKTVVKDRRVKEQLASEGSRVIYASAPRVPATKNPPSTNNNINPNVNANAKINVPPPEEIKESLV